MEINVLLGAPGSGKGTQAKRLSSEGGFHHLSTGDMLRAAIKEGSEVGLRAKAYIDRGDLVPDRTMIDLIDAALGQLPSDAKVLLDGFPRTIAQADALDLGARTRVSHAIYLEVSEPVLVERLTGRRVCEKCGEPFHVVHLPPRKLDICDRCGGRLIQRSDDSESVVGHRLQVFRQQSAPLLDYYARSGKLRRLDAESGVAEILHGIRRILG